MYKALIAFAGAVTMAEGEIKEILDKKVAKDLLDAHYIEEVTVIEKPARKAKKTPKGE